MLAGEERAGSTGSCGLGVTSFGGGDGVLVLARSLGEVSSAKEDRCTSNCCLRCSLHAGRWGAMERRGGEGGDVVVTVESWREERRGGEEGREVELTFGISLLLTLT